MQVTRVVSSQGGLMIAGIKYSPGYIHRGKVVTVGGHPPLGKRPFQLQGLQIASGTRSSPATVRPFLARPPGRWSLRSARGHRDRPCAGRWTLEIYFASVEFDPEVFTPADHIAAFGAWSWLGAVAAQALATDQGGIVDDDLAYVTPWGCDPRQISTPVLFVHGALDRLVPSSHAT